MQTIFLSLWAHLIGKKLGHDCRQLLSIYYRMNYKCSIFYINNYIIWLELLCVTIRFFSCGSLNFGNNSKPKYFLKSFVIFQCWFLIPLDPGLKGNSYHVYASLLPTSNRASLAVKNSGKMYLYILILSNVLWTVS